nr:unnamed protein product [Digitaria exilis]
MARRTTVDGAAVCLRAQDKILAAADEYTLFCSSSPVMHHNLPPASSLFGWLESSQRWLGVGGDVLGPCIRLASACHSSIHRQGHHHSGQAGGVTCEVIVYPTTGRVVASLVDEPSSCSKAQATPPRALQQVPRRDGGGGDPLRRAESMGHQSRRPPPPASMAGPPHSTPDLGTVTSSVKRMMRCGLKGGGRVASWGGDRRSPAVNPSSSVRMPAGGGGGCCSGLRSRASDLAGLEMASLRGGVGGLFRSSPRYGRLQATAAGASRVSGYGFAAFCLISVNFSTHFIICTVDPEDIPLEKVQVKSSGHVLPYVGVACLGAILFGYHLGVVNGALEHLAKDLGIAENAVLQGWVVSTSLAGATVGSFTGGSLADKFGRTRTFILDAVPLALGAFLSATAQDIRTMIIGRLLAGIGIGISSALVPLYISEISPTEIRGTLGSVNQLFICIGILAALLAGLPLAANPSWWRTMFGIAVVPSILLAVGMAFSPESPRWLFQQGKVIQAESAVKRLYGKEKVTEVMYDLRASGQSSSEPEAGWFDLFSKRYWKVVSVGAALFLFQQLAGINAVVYYSTSVFRSAGIASDVAASALVGAANVFGTMIASSLMDKQGRKSLLITSFSGMGASMLLLALSFTWKALAPYSGTLAVVGTVL